MCSKDNEFELYESVKLIHAKKATGRQYIAAREEAHLNGKPTVGWSSHNPELNHRGFHVVYRLGTDEEYHSWSPAKAFVESTTKCAN